MKSYDPVLFQNIIAWIGGVGAVTAATSKLKKLLVWLACKKYVVTDEGKTLIGYVASIFLSIVIPVGYLWLTDQLNLKLALLMAVPMWMMASGIYDEYHTPKE